MEVVVVVVVIAMTLEEVGVMWGVVKETAIVTELVNKLDPEIQMGRFG